MCCFVLTAQLIVVCCWSRYTPQMPNEHLMRWQDVTVIMVSLGIMVAIGVYCARRTQTADAYFLANRSMPGWIVAFSLMATLISSMTFLALPGSTFKDDWRFMPALALYFVPAIVAYLVFVPFFRRGQVRSAYEYLEHRFGTWARLYGAAAIIFYHVSRTGVILYVVSLPFQQMAGVPLPYVICFLGILVAIYTIAGGIEAVIYTDLLQGIALILGGLLCMPVIAHMLPGGMGQIFHEAIADQKFFQPGTLDFDFSKKTVWVIILVYQFHFLQLMCTDQAMVQRYLAMKSDADVRFGYALGIAMTIPVWLYFALIGTALYVYYKNFPTPAIDGMEPEEIFPYFILTQIPAGVAGFVIVGLLSAAMSTLDSSINASASTITTDFYRRFQHRPRDERHYLIVGRWSSVVLSAVMIAVALTIHAMRSETLMDLQTLVYSVVSAGLLSLFLLGFLTVRVGSRAALIATVATVLLVGAWVPFTTNAIQKQFPAVAQYLPNEFWIGVLPHLFLLLVGYALSFVFPRPQRDLTNLTIWTSADDDPE